MDDEFDVPEEKPNLFQAQYDSSCWGCGMHIAPGDMIGMVDGTAHCEDCVEGYAYPTTGF
jgi:hypothetical protein